VSTGEEPRRPAPRPARPPRRPPRRRIRLSLAAALMLVTLAIGLVVGYAAHRDDAPAGLVTDQRDVPVVTVTVPTGAPGTTTAPVR
jgi:ferric-dicitrate binding protein FerR (iron transport regulator)